MANILLAWHVLLGRGYLKYREASSHVIDFNHPVEGEPEGFCQETIQGVETIILKTDLTVPQLSHHLRTSAIMHPANLTGLNTLIDIDHIPSIDTVDITQISVEDFEAAGVVRRVPHLNILRFSRGIPVHRGLEHIAIHEYT